jgi:hypothetical protein
LGHVDGSGFAVDSCLGLATRRLLGLPTHSRVLPSQHRSGPLDPSAPLHRNHFVARFQVGQRFDCKFFFVSGVTAVNKRAAMASSWRGPEHEARSARHADPLHRHVGEQDGRGGGPLGRLGLPGKVAGGIVYIASNEAGFITAHILNRRRVQRQLTLAVGEGSRRAGLREPARCGRDRYVELRQD